MEILRVFLAILAVVVLLGAVALRRDAARRGWVENQEGVRRKAWPFKEMDTGEKTT